MRNENESKFKSIRDCTIAHRDHNISAQIEILNSIDNDWVMGFSLEYMKLIEELHVLMNKTIKFISADGEKLGKENFLKKYGSIGI
jgi:hypothetical protein